LRQLICGDLPPRLLTCPVIPAPVGNVTTRQRYEAQHPWAAAAVATHTSIKSASASRNFDGVGVYRTLEAGQAVDTSGYIEDLNHTTFNGPEDLAKKLAASAEVNRCMAAQMTAYVLGAAPTTACAFAPPPRSRAGATPLSLRNVLAQVVEPRTCRRASRPERVQATPWGFGGNGEIGDGRPWWSMPQLVDWRPVVP